MRRIKRTQRTIVIKGITEDSEIDLVHESARESIANARGQREDNYGVVFNGRNRYRAIGST